MKRIEEEAQPAGRQNNGSMALRWAAAAFVETEKNYRRVMGYQNLWMLKAHLDENPEEKTMAKDKKLG